MAAHKSLTLCGSGPRPRMSLPAWKQRKAAATELAVRHSNCTTTGRAAALKWNPQLLDKHIAPGISNFSQANIPDLSGKFPQADHLVANFFLNSILRASY